MVRVHAGEPSFAKATDGFASFCYLKSFRSIITDGFAIVNMFYTYILHSSKSKLFYYGFTKDIRKRIGEHNDGKSLATKPHIPWILVWYCGFVKEKEAKDFELYLKSGSGKAFAYKRLVSSFRER